MQYTGKLALITGGSSGIGLELARQLAAQGSDVWLLARDSARLSAACQSLEGLRQRPEQRFGVIAADAADYEPVQAALKTLVEQTGCPDLLFNCAGFAQPGYFAEQDLEVFRKTMEINYFGTLHIIKALLPAMIQRRSGHIVNVSSLAGFMGVYGYSAYGPAKFAIRGLSDTLRYELAEHNIRVSVVFPPDTQTPQLDYENQFKPPVLVELDKSNKVMTAEAVARMILKDVARGRYIITPGFDSSLYFQLTNFFGLVYPAMDFMVAQARRALGRSNGNGAAKDQG